MLFQNFEKENRYANFEIVCIHMFFKVLVSNFWEDFLEIASNSEFVGIFVGEQIAAFANFVSKN